MLLRGRPKRRLAALLTPAVVGGLILLSGVAEAAPKTVSLPGF